MRDVRSESSAGTAASDGRAAPSTASPEPSFDPNPSPQRESVWSVMSEAAGNLYAGYFTLVMSTGIIAISLKRHGVPLLAWTMFPASILFYLILVVAMGLRIAHHPERVIADYNSHWKGPGHFTFPAATLIIGIEWVVIAGSIPMATAMLVIGGIFWALITYTFIPLAIVREDKPSFGGAVNGAWFIIVVSTQSIALLGEALASVAGHSMPWLGFASFALFLAGLLLYLFFASFILLRLVFYPMTPKDLSATYWVSMGALAITCMAALRVSTLDSVLPQLHECKGFVLSVGILAWAGATWWFPHLIFLGVWRHRVKKYPLVYNPRYWSIVFPLGMYSVCTREMSKVWGIAWLGTWSRIGLTVAFIVWLIVIIGMIKTNFVALLPRARLKSPTT